MARRVSIAQINSKIREVQNKQRQAIQKYNQEVRRYNQKAKSAVDEYNREVRAHNARVRQNRQRIKNALDRLRSAPATSTQMSSVFRTSAYRLHDAYIRLEQQNPYGEEDSRYRLALELPQRENVNNLTVANALITGESDELATGLDLQSTSITDELSRISPDLDDRWHGALHALHPRNRDAARHFCASVREIFTQILHTRAPDQAVLAAMPDRHTDANGRPTRRARIRFLLHRKNMTGAALEEFVEQDIDNVIDLFSFLNKGTHGAAGTFDLPRLVSAKRRVEDAIVFVSGIAG
jgi:hypothetical protein